MFYRMATGALPHQGESARDTLTKRLTEPPTPLALAAPDTMFPEGLQRVVDRVLARKPGERYPTAGAFGTALVELFTGPLEIATLPTVRLDTVTAPVPAPVPSRRGRALAAGGVIGAAVIAALVILRPTLGNGGNTLTDTQTVTPPPSVILRRRSPTAATTRVNGSRHGPWCHARNASGRAQAGQSATRIAQGCAAPSRPRTDDPSTDDCGCQWPRSGG
jgi:serine/threonine-protein kinase